jgi:hypothetical protein
VTEPPIGRVQVPNDVDTVTVRAHDKIHGYGGAEMTVELTR